MRTAEEILRERVYITRDDMEDIHDSISSVTEAMIEFSKMHVEAALKEANEKVFAQSTNSNLSSKEDRLTCIHLGKVYVNKDSIFNAYPLDLIK